jgi:hypothetical protein
MTDADVINLRTQATDKQPRKKPAGEELIFYRPEMCLSAKDTDILGPLQWASSWDNSPINILEGIYRCVQAEEMQARLASSDPIVRTKALCAISMAYEILCRAGYKDFLPLHNQLQIGLRRLAQTGRKVLTRKLLSPTTTDEEADQISSFLVDMAWKRGDVGSGNA